MQETTTNKPGKKKIVYIAGLLALLIGAAAGGWWYYSASRIATDDARVKGTIVPISTKIQGKISEVFVENGTDVTTGMLLAKLDTSELDAQLQQAQAALHAAQAKLAAATAGNRPQDIAQTEAGKEEANAALEDAQKNLHRTEQLYAQGAISEQQLDAARTTLQVARAKYEAATQNYSLHLEGSRPEDIQYAQAEMAQAEAAVKNLTAQIENCTIRASANGKIDGKAAECGQTAIPGMTLFNIVALDDVWVSANIEETYIGKIKEGDVVDIAIDAYPGRKFTGHVLSIGSAAGSQFSLLPAENTSGNFTKVTQRFEVKIQVEQPEEHVLKPGMSAIITVHV